MGTIHKFERPPKNENQFKGYRPLAQLPARKAPGRWKKLRPWQRALLVWTLLTAVAAIIVGVRALLLTIK